MATTRVTVNGSALAREVHGDVLDREPGCVFDPFDEVASQPPGTGGGVGRDDDRVGTALGDGVHRRQERVAVAHFAGGLDALLGDDRQRQVDAHLRRFTHGFVVDHESRRRLALRHHQPELRSARIGPVFAHRVEQRCASERAVGDHQDFLHVLTSDVMDRAGSRLPSPHRRSPAAAVGRRSRARRPGRRTRRDLRQPSARGRS